MNSMFYKASSFNQPLTTWNTGKVINMGYMFGYAYAFNNDVPFNTSSVTFLSNMFVGASSFDHYSIASWDVSKVINFQYMFKDTMSFNIYLANWNTAASTNIQYMFHNSSFNQDILSWNVLQVQDMSNMFHDNTIFNQNLADWNMLNKLSLNSMFYVAISFNQDLCQWGCILYGETTIKNMFYDTACPYTANPIFTRMLYGPFCYDCSSYTGYPTLKLTLHPKMKPTKSLKPTIHPMPFPMHQPTVKPTLPPCLPSSIYPRAVWVAPTLPDFAHAVLGTIT